MKLTVHDWHKNASMTFTIDDVLLIVTNVDVNTPMRETVYSLSDSVKRIALAGEVTKIDVRDKQLKVSIDKQRRPDGTFKDVISFTHEIHF